MKYAVDLTSEAEEQLLQSFAYIHARSPLNAARWLDGIYRAIASLDTFPQRGSIAREAETLNRPLRQLLYKSHRIIYLIDETKQTVIVLHVRHHARRAIGEAEEESD